MKKSVSIIFIGIIIAFISASITVVNAKERIIEGVISDYECGDNCYLTIKDIKGKEHTGLCGASMCQKWNDSGDMPEEFKGKKVKITVGRGFRYDGEGHALDKMDLFNKIVLLKGVVHAGSKVTTPGGRLTAGLPVPIQIDIEYPQNPFTVDIVSGGNKIITITKNGSIPIKMISTRFQGVAKEINTTISYADGSQESHSNFIDLPTPASIPNDVVRKNSDLGGKIFEFTQKGKDYTLKQVGDQTKILILNAVSKQHFVNEATIKFTNGKTNSLVKVFGSPYWFEPFVVFQGNYDNATMQGIQSN